MSASSRHVSLETTAICVIEDAGAIITLVLMGAAPKLVSCIVAIAVASTALSAREYRSHEVTREFQREHPCPSTGRTTGACPRYRRDHIKPLACGGPDAVSNLQWQTITDAKAKDRWERRACAR